jgi:hypothetical protein
VYVQQDGDKRGRKRPKKLLTGREWKMGECRPRQIDKELKRVEFLLMPPKWPGQQPVYIHDLGHNFLVRPREKLQAAEMKGPKDT